LGFPSLSEVVTTKAGGEQYNAIVEHYQYYYETLLFDILMALLYAGKLMKQPNPKVPHNCMP